MKHDIDILVADICTSYPELAVDDSVVREIVTELISHQPAVSIDESFKTRLRTELAAKAKQGAPKKAGLPWWLVYTVPVGVTAILLLVISPDLLTTQKQSTESDAFSPSINSSLKMDDADGRYMEDSVMEGSDATTEAVMDNSDFFTAAFLSDLQSVRVAYMTLSQPGFIVVSGPEGVMAISGLMLPGEHTNTMIPVMKPVQSGTTYNATLYYDNGDGVFNETFDAMAGDHFGQSVTMPLLAP